MAFHEYPYTDFHEMNLDWLIAKVKELTLAWAQTSSDWEELRTFVNNYFANLNVQEEINNKMDELVSDGTLSSLIAPYVKSGLPAEVANQIAAVVADQIGAVVAAQLPARVAEQIPAAVAGEAANWLSEHVDPSTGYVVDDTLTIQGAAADAKAVGDDISNQNIAIDSKIELRSGYIKYSDGTTADHNGLHYIIVNVSDCKAIKYNTLNSTPDARGIGFFDDNGNFISGYQTLSTQQFIDIPNNAAIMKATVENVSDIELFVSYDNIRKIVESYNVESMPFEYEMINDRYVNYIDGFTPSITGLTSIKFDVSNSSRLYYYATILIKDNRGLAFYDMDGNYISGVQMKEVYQAISIPNGATTCKATVNNANEIILVAPVANISGKEEQMIYNATSYSPADITWISGKYVNASTGNFSNLAITWASGYIPVGKNKHCKIKTTGFNDSRGVAFYDRNKIFIPGSGLSYPLGYNTIKVNIPNEAVYIAVTMNDSDRSSNIFAFEFYDTANSAAQDTMNFENSIEKYTASSLLTMFSSIGCCGDSYTRGQIYDQSGVSLGYFPKNTWCATLARLYNLTANVYARGGATTESYITDSDCLPAALSAAPEQLYILCLGINDRLSVQLGTIADIKEDYTQNPNTFYGNYGRIIEMLMKHAPNAKFIIVKSFIPVDENGNRTPYYNYSSIACEEIASHYGFPFVETIGSGFFRSEEYCLHRWGGHPTAPLYAGMGKALGELIDKVILQNVDYFGDFTIPN